MITEEIYNKAEKIANEARKSISNYCMTECNSLCCRKGSITLSAKEVKLIFGKNFIDPKLIEVISDTQTKLNLNFGCPAFIDNKCNIHNKRNRPTICKKFPLFIRGDRVILSHDCPAVEDNKFYPFLSKFKKMGFKIV